MSTLHEAKIYPTSGVDAVAYRKATFELAKSIRIKNSYAAKLVNKAIVSTYGSSSVDVNEPGTWAYYLNQSGEYHWADAGMIVSSIDTGEEILFSKDNLLSHKNTAAFYAFGTQGYNSLVKRFPTQKLLIDGILNPCDLMTAVNADDGTILAHQTTLVEPWEKRLLPALEAWIKVFNHRWHIPGFSVTDKYYVHAQAAVLASQLPARIMLERLRSARTQEAHSFHVRAYLASNGGLDSFYPFLTRNQALWLYQNIKYIDHQRGQEKTLQRLIEHLLDEVGFGASSISGVQHDLYKDGYPVYRYIAKPLTKTHHAPPERTLHKLYNDERSAAVGNDDFQESVVSELASHLTSTVLKTKVIDVSHVDYQNSERFTLENIAIDAWGYLSVVKRMYAIRFHHTTPVTRKTIALSMADAFIYFVALLVWRNNPTQTYFPDYLVRMYPENTIESNKQLLNSAPQSRWTTKQLNTIRKSIPTPNRTLIQSGFKTHCAAIHHWYTQTERTIVYGAGSDTEAHRSRIIQTFSRLKPIPLPSEPLTQWVERLGLDTVTDHTMIDTVLNELYEKCTGISMSPLQDVSIRHAHLIGLLKRLSSYSVQFIGKCNSYPAYCLDHLRVVPSASIREKLITFDQQQMLCSPTSVSVIRKASATLVNQPMIELCVSARRLPTYENHSPAFMPSIVKRAEAAFTISLPLHCFEVTDVI